MKQASHQRADRTYAQLREHYESLGFTYVGGKSDYCVKDLL